ncbi:TOMM precursor leader peptide-binding protein [Kitasatospora sp. NPDC053057]|uniref:TOMM precursor leader peptide-binding protein n=1 Tax=Kitasatospora sp. NPDC053057 TaxID=3364062 RepID=UPI0037C6CC7B
MTDIGTPARPAAPVRAGAATVALLGSPWLAAAPGWRAVTAEELTQSDPDVPDVLIVAATDPGDPEPLRQARAWAAAHRRPWLPVRLLAGQVVLGPAGLPDRPGCLDRPGLPDRPSCPGCAELRERDNSPEPAHRELLPPDLPVPPLSPLLLDVVRGLVADEATRLTDPAEPTDAPPRTAGAVLRVATDTGATSRSTLLPHPYCPHCGALPPDSATAAVLPLPPAPKLRPDVPRTAQPDPRALADRYVDPVTGVIASVDTWSTPAALCATARPAPARAVHASANGYGRAFDLGSTRLAAVLEALERLGGEAPRGRRTTVTARFRDVADHAVDPQRFGLHHPEQHGLPGFPFAPYTPERELRWVWGYSLGRGEPVLVPESYVYYNRGHHDDTFVFETSNGCALGNCPAEAALHGLLEVAERDAFLLTWYARLPVPEVDLASAADRRIPLLAELARHRLGYRLRAFATATEHRVPAFWVLAEADPAAGSAAPRGLNLLCGAGTGLSAERALLRSLAELTGFLSGADRRHDPDRARRMLADPGEVRTMDDHATLYGHPAARERLGFLGAGAPPVPLATVAAATPWPEHRDLVADLTELVGRFTATGLDVVVVDQTSAEHRAGGLSCVKVLVPGTLPMTFGHRFRRTHGLPRLLTVPRLLGHRDRDLTPAELNPDPHPFP